MIGHVNATALEKLVKNTEVLTVDPSKIEADVFPAIQASESGKVDVIVNVTILAREEPRLKRRWKLRQARRDG